MIDLIFSSAYSIIAASFIGILNLIIVYLIIKKISVLRMLKKTRYVVYNSFKAIDHIAKDNIIKRIRLMDNKESSFKVKFNLFEKFDLLFIERSNIRRYIPFFNIYILFSIMAIIFFLAFLNIYTFFHSIITSTLLSFIITLIPIILLDILGRYNSEKIRSIMTDFLSLLKSWIDVKNDLVFALHQTINSDIPEPLKTYLKECLIQIKKGIDIDVAFDLLAYKVNSVYFYTVILNLKQALKSRGNLSILLEKLENEAYLLEDEFSKRKHSAFVDRCLLVLFMLLILFVVYYSLFMSAYLRHIYIETASGRSILDVVSVLFGLGFYMTLKSTKFDY